MYMGEWQLYDYLKVSGLYIRLLLIASAQFKTKKGPNRPYTTSKAFIG